MGLKGPKDQKGPYPVGILGVVMLPLVSIQLGDRVQLNTRCMI